jgi:hypothetical protein
VVEALPAFGFDPMLKTQSTRFLFQLEMGSHAAKKGRRLAQADAEALIPRPWLPGPTARRASASVT